MVHIFHNLHTMTILEQRNLIRRLLDSTSPTDAPTAYYALFHTPAKSALTVQTDDAGRAVGFVADCRTGIDLFRSLITLRCVDTATQAAAEIAADLLQQALTPNRSYILFASADQIANTGGSLQLDTVRTLHIYQLDRARFEPVINVLVKERTSPDGSPRCVIETEGRRALAGVNWQSPRFAEIFVHTDAAARQRGWGISVTSALTQMLLASGRTPIYLVEPENEASRNLAEKLGYVDTGAQQIYADVVYLGHPGAHDNSEMT
ncbi:MAG: GNAT family N-acetyltransferase [Anaerolineae bacterium]|nr:GNAT family N-acetyltransferase [Anaerolineae bacterium]